MAKETSLPPSLVPRNPPAERHEGTPHDQKETRGRPLGYSQSSLGGKKKDLR